jgi:glycosyltransferase involved in cell wall biosynthesis
MMDHGPADAMDVRAAVSSEQRIPMGRLPARRPDPRPGAGHRPRVAGRFLYAGDEKLWVRGVTYGTFRPRFAGDDGYIATVVDADFARMVAAGINAIRLYEVPPAWLLDLALQHGLWVSVDVPWEEHIAFLDRRDVPASILARTSEAVRRCAGHPAVLAFSVGNEIPSRIVRWHGRRPVVDFIDRLADAARRADPGALITYVNYPSTEYVRPRGLDFDAWNVYLEGTGDFERYIARLQNLSPDRPVIIAELGADSRRLGEAAQADLVSSQVRAAFAAGSAGTFVFAWTDEWARSGIEVNDWDFGMTTRDRSPKPALAALEAAYGDTPFRADLPWPAISVALCSYNGSRVIRRCLEGLARQDYPDYEVIVIDDGSTDDTARIAAEFDVTLIKTPNQGLSAARNEALARARGEIVAYIDDDAWPDPDWLRHLAWVYLTTDHAGVGGPNLPPHDDGPTAALVALAPGGPLHVLRSDTEAEHIPGCNSSFRTEQLRAIGGYDVRFRTAGDDVDVCWRLHERGETIGFSAGAMVWHHRRPTVRGYLRQQRGYGLAEALLERKWASRFNGLGHVSWPGQLYGSGADPGGLVRSSVYAGTWGTAPYQSIYERSSHWAAAPLMPEWWLAIVGLLAMGVLGWSWSPLWLAWPVALAMTGASVLIAAAVAIRQTRHARSMDGGGVRRTVALAGLVLGQSVARLRGRLAGGLVPWRRRGDGPWIAPRTYRLEAWSEDWHAMEARLRHVERDLESTGIAVRRGGPTDRWDLEVRVGSFGRARSLGTIEEHGNGRQMVRWRTWPTGWGASLAVALAATGLALLAVSEGGNIAAAVLVTIAGLVLGRTILDLGQGLGALVAATGASPTDR